MMRKLVLLLFLVSLIAAHNSHAGGETITGIASVIDGDTIEIHGTRIRLFGIDAPESSQLCSQSSKQYRCGQKAALFLQDLIGKQTVRCVKHDKDRYGRMVAECFVEKKNLNAAMVSQGWAIAYRKYSDLFITQESEAKNAGRGLWAGTFQAPWDFRHQPCAADKVNHGDCLIKGNINGKGIKLYHLPGMSSYGKTKITMAKGERWFCSEEEARAAGWQKVNTR